MKIKTWIKYEEGYLPPRCRKLRYKVCEEYVNINLSETTLAELQLAFEDLSYNGAGKIFLYKGKLWKKTSIRNICAGGEDEYRYHTPLEALAWWNEHGSKYFRYGCGSYHGEEYTKKLYSNKLDLICVVSFWWMESFIAVLLNRDTVFIHLGWDTTTGALRCP